MEPIPRGFRARRTLTIVPGVHPKASYDEVRRPLEASRDVLTIVLSLVPAAPPKEE
jgi:hypothetical protein